MSDSTDEWDGGAIDGRDQYLGDAPYWNGDGKTVDVTDNSEGQVTTENVPDPGEKPGADSTDGTEAEGAEVPTWPPNAETLTEIRQRLLNGSSTVELGERIGVTGDTIRYAATGENHSDVDADIPPLTTKGNTSGAKWVIDERDESQSELTDDDFEASESRGSWPPLASCIDNIRRRLVDGSSLREVAEDYDDANKAMVADIAKGETYQGHPVQDATETPPVQHAERDGWVWVIDEGGETQSESTDDDWPPTPDELDDIRRGLVAGESAAEIAEEYPVSRTTMDDLAKAETYPESEAIQSASTPPVESPGNVGRNDWVWAEPVDLETETTDNDGTEQETGTTDNDDAEPETETTETEEELGPEPDQQDSGLVSGDERPVARDPPEPETPTVPTRWLVAGVAFVAGWILSRLVRGGED